MNDGIKHARAPRSQSLDGCVVVVDEAHQMLYPEGTVENHKKNPNTRSPDWKTF